MGLFDRVAAVDALKDLFERERAAILEGRFDVLDRMAAEKERLMAATGRGDAPAAVLAVLNRQAERNRNLLQAMDAGVRAALGQVEQLRSAPAALHTYDASGRRRKIRAPAAPGTLRRRA